MAFGTLLHALRKEHNLYQKELAAYLNVSIGTISNYENSIHCPDLDTLCKLADYFHVSTDYLLERSDYRNTPDSLSTQLRPDYSLSTLVNTILKLDSEKQYALLAYVEFLKNNSM